MTQEDGLKLIQYNGTKYTNLFYKAFKNDWISSFETNLKLIKAKITLIGF